MLQGSRVKNHIHQVPWFFSLVPAAQLFSKEILEQRNESVDHSAPGNSEFPAEAKPKEVAETN